MCIIEHFGNADAVPQPPERCLSHKAGIVRCCLSITQSGAKYKHKPGIRLRRMPGLFSYLWVLYRLVHTAHVRVGGGTATINAIPAVDKVVNELEGDERTGAKIVRKALEAPLRQIAKNAGLEGSVIIDNILKANKANYGFDAQKEEYVEDMIEAGIVDPTKVTRSALENAASVAAMVLTTESLVADLPEPPAPAAPNPDMGGMY